MSNKFYAIIKGGQKLISFGWEEASALTQGVRGVKFKGFVNRQEAEAWLENPSGPAPPLPPKVDAFKNYKIFLASAKEANLVRYYTDAAYLANIRYAGVGVFSPELKYQYSSKLDFESHTNQRGEILGLDLALKHYKAAGINKYPNGMALFTDSQWSVNMVLVWPAEWERKLTQYNALHPDNERTEWFTGKGNPVKHSDIVRSILQTMDELKAMGVQVRIHWIPREYNQEADWLSRGRELVEKNGVLVLPST